jgi:hypothetical protein
MVFETKDEKIDRVEKKVAELERKLDYNIGRMNESITMLNEIILHMEAENKKLRNEKSFLIERHKKMLKRVPVPDLSYEINERFVKPAKNTVRENMNVVRLAAREGFVEIRDPVASQPRLKNPARELKEHIISGEKKDSGKSIDTLYELIAGGSVRSDEAARKMNVHEVQVEEWARILEENDLITIKKGPFGKLELINKESIQEA